METLKLHRSLGNSVKRNPLNQVEDQEFDEQLYVLRTQIYQLRSASEDCLKALHRIEELYRKDKGMDARSRIPLKSDGRRRSPKNR